MTCHRLRSAAPGLRSRCGRRDQRPRRWYADPVSMLIDNGNRAVPASFTKPGRRDTGALLRTIT